LQKYSQNKIKQLFGKKIIFKFFVTTNTNDKI
jgi:hypothetical protein